MNFAYTPSSSTEPPPPPPPPILTETEIREVHSGSLVNVSDCLFHFSRGGRVWIRPPQKGEPKKIAEPLEFVFHHRPKSATGNCSHSSSIQHGHLTLTYELRNETDEIRTIVLHYRFLKHQTDGHWVVDKLHLLVEPASDWPKRNFSLHSKELQAPDGFSFSCARLELQSKIRLRVKEQVEESKAGKTNKKEKEEEVVKESIRLHVDRFQIQPFNSEKVFASSFDCSTLFTIPQFAGLFSLFAFTFITAIGIYALSRIQAMERFDNLKNINLIVPSE